MPAFRFFLYCILCTMGATVTCSLLIAAEEPETPQNTEYLLDRSGLGYRIQYLDDWTIRMGEPGDYVDAYFSYPDPDVEINILVLDAPENISEIDETTLDIVSRESRNAYRDVQDFSSVITTFHGKSAGIYEMSGIIPEDENDFRAYIRQYIVLHNKRFYIFTLVCAHEDTREARSVWKRFLDHIELVG